MSDAIPTPIPCAAAASRTTIGKVMLTAAIACAPSCANNGRADELL
ncbi:MULTISPECIES: hypothetical protein [Bradyrhizobium]|nr:hypothetical protein [Bradyrhizobium barranii]WFU00019.1 hypothetical protein QA633_06690 [Bradyrhizobium barranii]